MCMALIFFKMDGYLIHICCYIAHTRVLKIHPKQRDNMAFSTTYSTGVLKINPTKSLQQTSLTNMQIEFLINGFKNYFLIYS